MHESSLMTGLMRRIEIAAAAESAGRVTGVSVWLGALSHISEDHFVDHFSRAAVGTIAEGARLDITVSEDPQDADAQDIRLKSIEVES